MDKFRIHPDYAVSFAFKTHGDHDPERVWASIDLGTMEYWRARLTVYDELMGVASEKFEAMADRTICHEIAHLLVYPLVSYCDNMFTEDEGKKAELLKLEESLVSRIETIFHGPPDPELCK